MKVQNVTDQANGLEGDSEDVVMGISEENHLTLLNSLTNLYANPVLAALREYSANAADAHKESGQTKPFEVDFPYRIDGTTYLRIRDYGKGMTKDQLTRVYSQYGASTKGSSNFTVGGFGLGSKSGLAVSNNLFVTTVADGVKIHAQILRNEDNTSVIRFLNEASSDEESGTEILLPLTAPQLTELEEKAESELIGYRPESLVLNSQKISLSVYDEKQFIPVLANGWALGYVQRNDMTLKNEFAYSGSLRAAIRTRTVESAIAETEEKFLQENFGIVMGGVYYSSLPSLGSVPDKEKLLLVVEKLRNRLLNSPRIILNIPVGSVDLPPHRDSIIDTVKSWNTLAGVLENMLNALDTSAQKYLNQHSLPQASKLVAGMASLFAEQGTWEHQGIRYENGFLGSAQPQPYLMTSDGTQHVLNELSADKYTALHARTRSANYDLTSSMYGLRHDVRFTVIELVLSEARYDSLHNKMMQSRQRNAKVSFADMKSFVSRYVFPYVRQQTNMQECYVLLTSETKGALPAHFKPAVDYSFTESEIRALHKSLFPSKARAAVIQKHCRVTEESFTHGIIQPSESVVFFAGKNEYGPDTELTNGANLMPSQSADLKRISNGASKMSKDYVWTRTGLLELIGTDKTLVALNDTRASSSFLKSFPTAVPLGRMVMDYYDGLDEEHKLAVQHAYSIISSWRVNIDPLFSLFVKRDLNLKNSSVKLMFEEPKIVAVANYLWAFKDSYVEGLSEWKKKFVSETRGKELAGTMLLPIQSSLDAYYAGFYTVVYSNTSPASEVRSKLKVRDENYQLTYKDAVKYIDRLTTI